jgi:hypothetical protein
MQEPIKRDDSPIEPANRAEAAIAMLSPLPFAADALPGIGGTIKATPGHFVVEEILPYAACGEGSMSMSLFGGPGGTPPTSPELCASTWG